MAPSPTSLLTTLTALTLLLTPITLSLPTTANSLSSSPLNITASALTLISPASASCSSAPIPSECRPASLAAPAITTSFATYGITSSYEAAALVSLMAFESGDFKYARNHFPAPGRPGQGTRNMQSPAFNALYAASIAELKPQVAALAGQVDQVLDLLLGRDEWDFGSAAWFLTSQCSAAVREGLQGGTEAGWSAWLSGCVGTAETDERKAYWVRATAALGGQ